MFVLARNIPRFRPFTVSKSLHMPNFKLTTSAFIKPSQNKALARGKDLHFRSLCKGRDTIGWLDAQAGSASPGQNLHRISAGLTG